MADLITLVLQPDNPCNTTITDSESGQVLYRVATEFEPKTVTRIRNADGATLAASEWRGVRSDLITLGTGAPVPLSAWLKKSIVPFKDTVHFEDLSGRKFKWKGNAPGLAFELYSAEDKSQPIARFHPSRRVYNKGTTPPTAQMTQAKLVIDPKREDMLDLIVISFLLLEKTRRSTEASTMNRADILGTPHSAGIVGSTSNYKIVSGGV